MDQDKNKIKIFGMPSSIILAEQVAKELGIELAEVELIKFNDGEKILKPSVVVRNHSVFIIANTLTIDFLFDLLIFIDSVKRASAKDIYVINSYYGYSRQDRKANKREPITAKLVANLLETTGVQHLMTIDLHNPSIQGFFDIPVDDLKWCYSLAAFLKKEKLKYTIVSPDHGGAVRARTLAELLSNTIKIAIIDKRRSGPNKSEIMNVLGNVKGENVVILDDMIDTGGTILKAARILKKNGAEKIYIAATHGIFSNGFQEFEDEKCIEKVFLSDSIEKKELLVSKKIEIISVAPLIANAIQAYINSSSISSLYHKKIDEENI
ncbi:MAG: ribose-phosphate pyrophosphokinase [Metamycoplasmataceae bacterium]